MTYIRGLTVVSVMEIDISQVVNEARTIPSHRINRLAADDSLVMIFNILMVRQNGHHFPEDILKWIFLNEIVWI